MTIVRLLIRLAGQIFGEWERTPVPPPTRLAVAAPDHKIGQCIQTSALCPGRADGGTHGSERFAGDAKRRGSRFGKGRRSPSPLGGLGLCGLCPRKIFKNQL